MSQHTFKCDGRSLTVYEMDGYVWITATTTRAYADASLSKKDAPAFALAVLEAAGFTADNSCAGDAIRSLKFQIANEARAAEEAVLDKEAEALARTHWDAQRYLFNWPKETDTFKDLWLSVARKARELHHVGEETSK